MDSYSYHVYRKFIMISYYKKEELPIEQEYIKYFESRESRLYITTIVQEGLFYNRNIFSKTKNSENNGF